MFTQLETGLGLDIVLALQANRSDLLDGLATAFNAMGGDIFFLIVLTFVYWSLNRQLGLRLLFALAVAGIVNTVLKVLFHRPRPFEVSDAVVPLFESGHFGIPSGHVMIALVVWGYAAWYHKSRWGAFIVSIFIIMMMWSRMYAGVHYPQDVIAGVIFGLLTLAIYAGSADRITSLWIRLLPLARIVAAILVSGGAALLLWTHADGLAVIGILIGTIIGIELESLSVQFDAGGQRQQRMIRYFVGLILIVTVFFGLRALFGTFADEDSTLFPVLRIIRYGLVAILALYVYPLAAVRFGLATRAE